MRRQYRGGGGGVSWGKRVSDVVVTVPFCVCAWAGQIEPTLVVKKEPKRVEKIRS
jgi:hypothetical protein